MALTLLVSGCGSVTGSYCHLDTHILPSDADIAVMSDDLAMRVDAHDELYEKRCR